MVALQEKGTAQLNALGMGSAGVLGRQVALRTPHHVEMMGLEETRKRFWGSLVV